MPADLSEQLILIEALFAIAHESNEAEMVRVAMAALTNTQAGLTYLSAHPFNV
jgi:hypothetical protein